MGKKRNIVKINKKDKKYHLEVKLDRERDKDLIDSIQKIPLMERATIIRSILYLYFIAGVRTKYDDASVETQTNKSTVKSTADIKSEIKSFLKIAKGNKDAK